MSTDLPKPKSITIVGIMERCLKRVVVIKLSNYRKDLKQFRPDFTTEKTFYTKVIDD